MACLEDGGRKVSRPTGNGKATLFRAAPGPAPCEQEPALHSSTLAQMHTLADGGSQELGWQDSRQAAAFTKGVGTSGDTYSQESVFITGV